MRNQESRILILGANGMAGSAFAFELDRLGHIVVPINREHFDVVHDPVRKLDLKGIDFVLNAIGLINRRLKTEPQNFYLVNSVFPRALADHCAARGVRLIHVSTDCVYDGQAAPYAESDPFTATDLYGRSKALGEPANCLVLRTSIIGPERQHFYSLLTWFLSQTVRCTGYRNHYWNGMTTIQLSRVIHQIIYNNLYVHGIRHVFSNAVSKLELLQLFRDYYGCPVEILPTDDIVVCDKRLQTSYPDFLERLAIPALRTQIAEIPVLTDAKGCWRSDLMAKFNLNPRA